MEALQAFKNYLLKQKTSKITVKNYLSDIRKFIRWYEATYQQTFHPLLVTAKAIDDFMNQTHDEQNNPVSAKSLKRYLSSLRKFFNYLHTLGAIPVNPFHAMPEKLQQTDPWLLKEFKNFLYSAKASKLTIKNYILDIRQFMAWLEEVTQHHIPSSASNPYEAENPFGSQYTQTANQLPQNIFSEIDSFALNAYKDRLLQDKKLSPVSINRKLSSLRKYITWLHDKQLIQAEIYVADLQDSAEAVAAPKQNALDTLDTLDTPDTLGTLITSPTPEELRILASVLPQGQIEEQQSELLTQANQEEEQRTYAKFGPLRFFQKSKKAITLISDLLILLPIIRLLQAGKYKLWKAQGRKVFAPINEIIGKKTLASPLSFPRTGGRRSPPASEARQGWESAGGGFVFPTFPNPKIPTFPNITNVPKSLYAPLRISTKHFSPYKKLLFHLRHTRPQWYRKYHSYAIVHYFHFAILLIFTITIGSSIYAAFFDDPARKGPVLAASTAPPRVLSFQGRLTDSTGTPITSATNLRFAIYNKEFESGSAQLWQETQTITPDEDGVFTAYLGKKTAINQTIFAENSSLYLGIAVGNDPELKPRQPLATVAYAANSETLQGLAPITQANAGTKNVILALDSSGNLTIGGTSSHTFQATGGSLTLSGQTLVLSTTSGSNGNVQISPNGLGLVDIQRPIQNTTTAGGTIIPGAVEIHDLFAILATSSANAALTLNQDGSGPLISASASGVTRFSVENNGAGTFGGNLTIKGNTLTTTEGTFNLINSTATTLNIGGAGTAISIGASSGITTINNELKANGGLRIAPDKQLIVSGGVGSHLIASTSAAFDLGSTSHYWRGAYLTNLFMSPSATTSGFWQRASGALSMVNITDDLLLGATATTSAKIGFLNIAGGTPTASISAQSGGGALSLTATSITTQNAQTLTLGGSTTGNIVIDSGSSAITLSDNTTISGNLTVSGTTSFNGVTYTWPSADGSSGYVLTTNGSGTLSWADLGTAISNPWRQNNGALYAANNSVDLLLGGSATTSAKFAVLNMNSGTPTASLSATTTGLALAADGSIQSVRNGTLTLGGNTTGHIAFAAGGSTVDMTLTSTGNLGIGTATPNQLLELSAVKDGTLRLASTQNSSSWTADTDTAGQIEFYTNDASGGGANVIGFIKSLTTATAGNLWALTFGTSSNNAAATEKMRIDSSGNVGINTTSPTAVLDVAGTASISGGLKLRGTSVLQSMNMQTLTLGGDTTGHIAFAPGNTTAMTLTSAGNVGIGTTTPGARLHVSGGNLLLDNAREINFYDTDGSTARTVLTVTNAGNTVLRAANSSGRLDIRSQNDTTFLALIDSSGFIGTGNVNTSPLASFDIRSSLRSTSGTIAIASVSGSTSFAAMTVDNNGVGDLFTASKSGARKFTVLNNGNVEVIGTATTCTIGNGTSATNCSSSDQRLKDNIASLSTTSGLDAIRQLNPVSYNWNAWMQSNGSSEQTQYGFIAQEVADIFPHLVEKDKNSGYFKLDYQGFFAPIVKSIQELDSKIKATDNIVIGSQTIKQYIKSIVSDVLSSEFTVHSLSKVVSPTGEIANLKTNLISPLASESAVKVEGKLVISNEIATSSSTPRDDVLLEVQGSASIAGTLRAERIIANSIEGLDEKLATLAAHLNQQNSQNSIYNNSTPSASQSITGTTSTTSLPETDPRDTRGTLDTRGTFENMASLSGALTYVPNFTAEFGQFNQGIIALGPTSLTDATISNQLRIGSSMTIDQNSINTFGTDLHIQPFRQANIRLMGDAVVIDTEGNLNVNGNANFAKDVTVNGKLMAKLISPVPNEDLIFQLPNNPNSPNNPKLVIKDASGSGVLSINHLGDLIASGAGTFKNLATNGISIIRGAQADTSLTETIASGSAGVALITANETERTIYSPYVQEDSLIYVTATSNTYGQTLYVARQTAENKKTNTKGSFSVQVSSPVTKDIKFNWWIVN